MSSPSGRKARKMAQKVAAITLASVAGLAFAAGMPSQARASDKQQYSEVAFACTASESWRFGAGVAKPFREKLKGAPSGKTSAVDSFIVGYAVKLVAKTPEVTALGEYWMYRAFYELGLIHFADRGFNAILNTAEVPETQGIKIAALGCMNEIHRKYPSLGIAFNAAWALGPINQRKLTEEQREMIWQAATTLAGRKLFVSGHNAQINGELELLKGSGPYETFVKAIHATTFEQDAGTVYYTERFLKYPKLPDYLKAQVDGAHLNLARVYYHNQEYDKSVAEFKKVKTQSNFYSRSLNDAAWAQIMRKNYSEAASSAFNLLAGDLRKTFGPESPVIIAMAQFENCHYKEAQETLNLFKRTYDQPYHWLYDWYHRNKTDHVELYPKVVEFLKSNKGVPEQIGSEWIRSPVFIAEQQELNLTFEEDQIAKDLVVAVEKQSKTQSQQLRTTFKGLLANFVKKMPETQKSVMDKITQELATRNNTMIATLVEAFETAQLVEVEIYNQAGEDMIKKKSAGKGTGLAKQVEPEKKKKKGDDGPPPLDWGRFPAGEGDRAETWGDELGALKTDVTNICKRK